MKITFQSSYIVTFSFLLWGGERLEGDSGACCYRRLRRIHVDQAAHSGKLHVLQTDT